MDSDTVDWESWAAMGAVGTFLMETVRRLVNWFRAQRQAILNQIEALRQSHEAHVQYMNTAHAENSMRLVKLENNEQHAAERLHDLCQMVKAVDDKQDRQTELLLNILNGRR